MSWVCFWEDQGGILAKLPQSIRDKEYQRCLSTTATSVRLSQATLCRKVIPVIFTVNSKICKFEELHLVANFSLVESQHYCELNLNLPVYISCSIFPTVQLKGLKIIGLDSDLEVCTHAGGHDTIKASRTTLSTLSTDLDTLHQLAVSRNSAH